MKKLIEAFGKAIQWIKLQVEWVKGFLQESDGKPSSTRMLKTAVIGSFLYPYIKNSIATQKMIDIPEMWFWVILITIGYKTVDNLIALKTGKQTINNCNVQQTNQ